MNRHIINIIACVLNIIFFLLITITLMNNGIRVIQKDFWIIMFGIVGVIITTIIGLCLTFKIINKKEIKL